MLPLLTDPLEIKTYLQQYGITDYTYQDGLINVEGDVLIFTAAPTTSESALRVQFGTVTGHFKILQMANLITLKGVPYHCDMFDLEELPQIKTLEYAPTTMNQFRCVKCNNLTHLQGLPPVTTKATITHCRALTTLAGLTSCPMLDVWGCERLTVLSKLPSDCTTATVKQCGIVMTLLDAPVTSLKFLAMDTLVKPTAQQMRQLILNHTYLDIEFGAAWIRLPSLCNKDLLAGIELFQKLYGIDLILFPDNDMQIPHEIEPLL